MTSRQTEISTDPTQHARRSQLYRRHLQSHARFEEFAGAVVVADYGEASNEAQQAKHLALADLSTLPRTGFKGADAPGWLEEQGARLPASPNRSAPQNDGSLVARLSTNELLILCDLASRSTLATVLQEKWTLDAIRRVYLLPRSDSHCWLALTGEHATVTLAKVCGVDLRSHKFAEREIAQTSLARINAIILRNDLATTPCFFILSDVSSAEYLWDALLDAMLEFDGRPVGIAAIRSLLAVIPA